jgi:hypothetical protein
MKPVTGKPINDLEASRRRALYEGAKVLCLTPTHYWVGRVVNYDALSIILEQASWIPSLGRHHEAIQKGTLDEVEPHGDVITEIPRNGTVVIEWKHELPTSAK